jgi:hypothetical protein
MKVGNNIIILSDTLLVPDGQQVEFEHRISEDDFFNCRFNFLENVSDTKLGLGPHAKVDFKDDWFNISFNNFNQLLATTINLNGFALSNKREPISIIAAIYKYKNMSKIEFQVMLQVAS